MAYFWLTLSLSPLSLSLQFSLLYLASVLAAINPGPEDLKAQRLR